MKTTRTHSNATTSAQKLINFHPGATSSPRLSKAVSYFSRRQIHLLWPSADSCLTWFSGSFEFSSEGGRVVSSNGKEAYSLNIPVGKGEIQSQNPHWKLLYRKPHSTERHKSWPRWRICMQSVQNHVCSLVVENPITGEIICTWWLRKGGKTHFQVGFWARGRTRCTILEGFSENLCGKPQSWYFTRASEVISYQ